MQLKWGIISCGFISGDFVEGLLLLPKEEHIVLGVSTEKDAGRAAQFATKHGLTHATAYGDYAQLCADPNINIVYIGNRNQQHLDCIKLALNAGKHVLCEKPLTVNLRQTREAVDLARQKNLFLMEGYWTRFFPAIKELKKRVADGVIGTPKEFHANFGAYFPPDNRVFDETTGGGGAVYDIGVYPLHLALHIFGYKNFLRADFSGSRHGDRNVDAKGVMVLYFKDDARAVLTYNGTTNFPSLGLLGGDRVLPDPPHFALAQAALIKICEPLWAPHALESNVSGAWERTEFPLPGSQASFYYFNSAGFSYQAQAVREAIMKGEVECPVIPLEESLLIHSLLQEYRKALGITFPQD